MMKEKPAGFAKGSAVGKQTPDLRGAGIVGKATLGEACAELQRQHPIKHDMLGPHQGQMTYIRHAALGGLRPTGDR